MNEKSEQFSFQEMQAALALMIWKNEHLRDEMLKSPREVIERELNVKFDENIQIKVVNQTEADEYIFVLPYNIHKAMGQELSDDQLEDIAGGFSLSDAKGIAKQVSWTQVGGTIGAIGGNVALPIVGGMIGGAVGREAGSLIDKKLRN